jgi:uncharacterized protein YraI
MIAAGALAAALVIPAAAQAAWYGVAATTVNLRLGPGTGYGRVAVVPAGARLTVFQCGGWCQVRFAGMTGWINARYVAGGGGVYAPGRIIVGPPPSYWDPGYPRPFLYPYRQWNRPWFRPGVNIWLGF